MSGFTKSFKFNINFEGDEVNFIMSRMKRKDALKLIPFMSEPDEFGAVQISFKDQLEVMNLAADLLPKYIKSMTGLKDEEGVELTIEDMADEAYFLKLMGEVINELMSKSFVGVDDVKKLNVPLEKDMGDSVTTENS